MAEVVVYRMNRPKRTQPVKCEEIFSRILESDDSDDDSNLSDDFDEIEN